MNNKDSFGVIMSGVSNGGVVVAVTGGLDYWLTILTLIIGIVSGVMSITYTLFKWYKRVVDENSDGGKSITINEVLGGIKEIEKDSAVVTENVDKLKEVIKNGDKNRK